MRMRIAELINSRSSCFGFLGTGFSRQSLLAMLLGGVIAAASTTFLMAEESIDGPNGPQTHPAAKVPEPVGESKPSAGAGQPTVKASPEDLMYFETRIRPLLIDHCHECHSGKSHKGELRLDRREGVLTGGESGPAIVPGEPDRSLLIQAVKYEGLEMPPQRRLPQEKIEFLVEWVRRGAPWPGEAEGTPGSTPHVRRGVTDVDRQHWSIRPLQAVKPPVAAGGRMPIDAFLESRLSQEGLTPNPPTDTRTLIRRLFFDLIGLPPTYSELEHWRSRLQSDDAGQVDEAAYQSLVNDLLDRPAYGERWGRHWLDVVRFAQSNGYERDGYKPNSWRYRDYVVRSFQQDKPYDRFILEQLAGDELPDGDAESRCATGFLRMGIWDDEPDDKRQAEFDELDDVQVTIGATFLGLTIGCARCHDHKFDPLPQVDYYRLLAHLRGLQRYENPQLTMQNGTAVPLGDNDQIRSAYTALKNRLQAREQALAQAANADARKQLEQQSIDRTLTGIEWSLGAREASETPPATQVLIRGNAATPGASVEPGFPQVLSPQLPTATAEGDQVSHGHASTAVQTPHYQSESPLRDLFPSSGRRLALARWLASPTHPLTPRVLVNRVWHYHFGRGIVASTGDFGRAGLPPTHPELLDWLAADFVEHGWSIKRLHRQIVASQAYRRSSRVHPDQAAHKFALQKDPDNHWLWRGSVRRLEAEVIRDRMLFSSGELNQTVGGREMYPLLSGEVLAGQSKPGLGWEPSPKAARARRSLYAVVKRGVRDPLLEAFDYSNVTAPLAERPLTTVAPQSLMLLFGRFTAERADALTQKVIANVGDVDRTAQVRQLFAEVLAREPSPDEVSLALRALGKLEQALLPSAGRLTFRPDVPVSLYEGYRKSLPGEQFLIGPATGWRYFAGQWGGGYESINVVEPRLGPFALWQGATVRDGTWQGKLRVDANVEYVTLIGRGVPVGDTWRGAGLTIDRRVGQIEARDRTPAVESANRTPHAVAANEWIDFRWELVGNRQRFWLGPVASAGTASPLVEAPLTEVTEGQLGVAVWGGQVEFDALQWQPAGTGTEDKKPSGIDLARVDRQPRPETPLPTGWQRYAGDWTLDDAGSWRVAPHLGAKLLWESQPLAIGDVQVDLRFEPSDAQIAGLLVAVSEPQVGADNWYGYEVSLNVGNQTVFVGDHRHNYQLLAAAPAVVTPGKWHRLRATLTDTRLLVYVDDRQEPAINLELPNRLPGQFVGLRTWGSSVAFQDFEMKTAAGKRRAEWPREVSSTPPTDDRAWARQQALAALTRTLFNLNEFMYVD